jgi:23S rRNA (adenine2030-N6)-methyltransferase
MNYRHAFHAGNFADCLKHTLLVWLLRALARKPAPLFVLDTHAGAGMYDLTGPDAVRTREAEAGIIRLLDDPPAELADFVAVIRGFQAPPDTPAAADEQGLRYPGSPCLIRALLRPDDRLACCELHPDDHAALRRLFARDPRTAVHHRDGWEALRALLPPRQKRALILIDPPFEAPDEFDRLATGLSAAHARFPTGVFAAWYPIKRLAAVRGFLDRMRGAGIRDVVTAEMLLREPLDPTRLNGCGLLVINPPYLFELEVPALLRALRIRLGHDDPDATATVTRLTDE